MDNYNDDDIVISGIGGRYPQADNTQELMENLFSGFDMTSAENTKWPAGSMGVPHKVGNMKDLSKCDAQFFGIIRKHCNSLDPVTRQILERTLEAVFDAGLNPLDLKGTNTGVFISCALLETEMILVQGNDQEKYGIMGRTRALNANRLSYWLDLKGPSFATDCLFNGGLQAIQDAYHGIKSGKIDAAIVGSGSTIIHANSSYQYQSLNVLSPDGNTRAFDANANGYARAEAVSVMLIQRARDAKRNHGTIVHVLNQARGENPSLILQPSQDSWKMFLEKFYNDCKIDPKQVAYLEADGVANLVMDAAELNAVGEVFCKGRTPDDPLLVGSIKTNMGHAEGASNMCAIAKLAIAMQADSLPGNLHYSAPNPNVRELIRGNIKVVTEPTPLKGDLVALNSFGLGSTYGHLLLRRNLRAKEPVELKEGTFPQLVLVSSRHEDGIKQVLDAVEAAPFDPEYAHLINNAFRRDLPGHMYRGYTVLSAEEINIRSSGHYSGDKHPVWFVFAGMGSQWPTMARDMLHLPNFKRSIDVSAKVLKAHGLDLIYLLTQDDPTLFDNIMHNFVTIVAVQIALVDVLRDMGVQPDGIIGHSVGETSASYADGCLTHEQTLLSAYYRGRASLETKVISGSMAAIGLGYQQIKSRLPEGIFVACHNGKESCTLSGPTEQVKEFVKQLSDEGVFARAVNVANIPYHSTYIKEMGPRMHDYLKHVIPHGKERSSRWVSTSIPEAKWGEPASKICSAEYHINNLLSPVLFEEASRHIPANAVTIEIAPHGLLQAILKRSLPPTVVNIPLTNRNAANQQHVFLKAVGSMYMNGLAPMVECLYPKVQYPVTRQTGFLSPLVTWDHTDNWSNFSSVNSVKSVGCKMLNLPLDLENSIRKAYNLNGAVVLPLTEYLMQVWAVFAGPDGKSKDVVELTDVLVHGNLSVNHLSDLQLYVLVQRGSGSFEVMHQTDDHFELVLTGFIQAVDKAPAFELNHFESIQEISQEEVYSELLHSGHEYQEELQNISKLKIGKTAWRASVDCNEDLSKLLNSLLQLRILQASDQQTRVQQIRKIRKIVIDKTGLTPLQAEAELDLVSNVVRCGKLEVSDVDFIEAPRNQVRFLKEELNAPAITLPPPSESLQVSYVQFNGSQMEGSQLAYIGTEGGQRKVMGLGVADQVSSAITEDPILKWHIPAKWTLEDAVPVALNYSLAYHAVHIVAQLKPGQSLVVTDGTNKLGVACLRVALDVAAPKNVFTVVNSEEERKQLKKLVPKILVENILVNEVSVTASVQLCLKLKTVCPKGVHVAINTGAPDVSQFIIQCVAPFGCIVAMSDQLFQSCGKLHNTSSYLVSASLYSCCGNDVINSHDDVKKQIQKLLAEGIASGVVGPFNEGYVKDGQQTQTVKLSAGSKGSQSARYQCDPDKAYMILGGDPYSWLSIAEWFINRKAKHVIAVHKETPINNSLQKKLRHLQERCNLVVKPANKLSPELIDHIFSVSRTKIALTMLVPMGPEDGPAENVVEALCQKDTFLVTVLPAGSEAIRYCKERNSRGGSTLTVLWNEPLNGKTESFLQTFDRLLNTQKNQVVQVNEQVQQTSNDIDAFETLLPNSLAQALAYGRDVPLEVRLTELQTKSIGSSASRETHALVVFPGLVNRDALVDRLRNLMYPVYIADFPVLITASIDEYAACIIPKLKSVCSGQVTLLGESWGGAVALEAARMLESMGEKTQVFLVAATPAELRNHWTQPQDLDISLLTRVFNTYPQVLDADLTWNERLTTCLATLPPHQDQLVATSLNSIRQKVATLLTPDSKQAINGSITCITRQPIRRSTISWMSRQDIALMVVGPGGDLLNDHVLQMIHNTVATKLIAR